jgi:hypothetical protein
MRNYEFLSVVIAFLDDEVQKTKHYFSIPYTFKHIINLMKVTSLMNLKLTLQLNTLGKLGSNECF